MQLQRHRDPKQQRQANSNTESMTAPLAHQPLGQPVCLYTICMLIALISFLMSGSIRPSLTLLTLIFMLHLFCSSRTFVLLVRADGTKRLLVESEGEHMLLHEASSNSCLIQQTNSIVDIQIADANNVYQNCKALLDTGCLAGNWISYKKVTELGLRSKIVTTKKLRAVTFSSEVHCYGSITLEWTLSGASKVHKITFYVGDSDDIEVILGNDFVQNYEAVKVNKWALASLWERNPPTIAENERAEQNRLQIETEAARIERRRRERAAAKAAAEAEAAQRQHNQRGN